MVHHFQPNFIQELSVSSKTMFISARLQRSYVFHCPWFINIVNAFRETGKSWCVKAKDRNHCWMCVTIQPSGGIVWETITLPGAACSVVVKLLIFQLVFGENWRWILRAKDEKYIKHFSLPLHRSWCVVSVLVQNGSCASPRWVLHIGGVWKALYKCNYLYIYMLPSRQPFPGTPCLFQQDNARPHSARVTTAWLHRHRVCVLD